MEKIIYPKRKERRKSNITFEDIRLVLQWVEDIIEGNMIESPGYNIEYLIITDIFEKELRVICDYINPILKRIHCKIRLIPAYSRIYYTIMDCNIKWIDGNIK
jgi:DNA phosphorothioation-dependent restriction protein DptG